MGRRKFSYRGKPHGRNELIQEYIWLAYLRSLLPGQAPDPLMRRDRKQISSHIQVLKTFFKDHPDCKSRHNQMAKPLTLAKFTSFSLLRRAQKMAFKIPSKTIHVYVLFPKGDCLMTIRCPARNRSPSIMARWNLMSFGFSLQRVRCGQIRMAEARVRRTCATPVL